MTAQPIGEGKTLIEQMLSVMGSVPQGEVLTYETLEVQFPNYTRRQLCVLFNRALKQFEEDAVGTFENVREIGYRRVFPNEHKRVGRRRGRTALRRQRSSLRALTSADKEALTAEERKSLEWETFTTRQVLSAMEQARKAKKPMQVSTRKIENLRGLY